MCAYVAPRMLALSAQLSLAVLNRGHVQTTQRNRTLPLRLRPCEGRAWEKIQVQDVGPKQVIRNHLQ